MRLLLLCLALVQPVAAVHAQQATGGAATTEWSVLVEPLAAGVEFAWLARTGWFGGAAVTAGPSFPIVITDESSADVREWAVAWPVAGYRSTGGVQLALSPIGAVVVIGNDFGTVYPAGQASLDLVRGRFRAGSALRIVRIAGANGTGLYRTLWIPIRLGLVLR